MSDRGQLLIQSNMEQETAKPKRDFRIRKLTERECLRLMDVDEDNINKMMAYPLSIPDGVNFKEWFNNLSNEDKELWKKKHTSKSQLYKQAGNSIVVSCLVEIFRQLFRPTYYEPEVIEEKPKLVVKPKEEKKEEEKTQYTQLSLFDFKKWKKK